MRSEKVVARIVDMSKMFYDEKKSEEGKVSEVLFLGLSAVVEGKAWDKNEWSKVMWEVGLQVEELPLRLLQKRTSGDINIYVLYI